MNFLHIGERYAKLNSSDETMISIQDLSKGFERENLFEHVNLVLHPKDKIALIGKNGAGKTTFFECITGKESFSGRIITEGIKISLMEQEQNFLDLNKTFEEYLAGKKDKLEKRKKFLEVQIGKPENYNDLEKFNSLMDEYNLLLTDTSLSSEEGGMRAILKELKIDETALNKKIRTLSGGQKTKLRIAECLAKKANLYLLDEPTNNLDLTTREWLEDYINSNLDSLIIISHDRYFLNKTVKKVWDLEDKQIKEWHYGFEEYLERKKKYLDELAKKYADTMKEKNRLLESAKQRRVRSSNLWNPTLAKRMERDAEKLEAVNPFDFIKEISVDFNSKSLHNCTIFRLEDIGKKFDKLLFREVNQEIEFGEKVCIIGENGAGKSTLLRILIGKLEPSEGRVYRRKDISIGYFDQELKGVDKEQTVMEFFKKETKKDPEKLIPLLLEYGSEKESFHKKIKQLSGGEKGRLNILRIASEHNNVLVLDEPTNNLDIYLVESLEKALSKFEGTIVFVSHDRYFIDKIATRIFQIKDRKVSSFRGNYSEYLEDSD